MPNFLLDIISQTRASRRAFIHQHEAGGVLARLHKHLNIALEEIGEIKPWYDDEVKAWVFSYKLYLVEYGGKTSKEVIKSYPKYLREFIRHRLDDKLSGNTEKRTKGRGGKREGAARPFFQAVYLLI
jgi:hypothetical protein